MNNKQKPRSWVLASVSLRTGGGRHVNSKDKRNGGRSQRRKAAAKDGW